MQHAAANWNLVGVCSEGYSASGHEVAHEGVREGEDDEHRETDAAADHRRGHRQLDRRLSAVGQFAGLGAALIRD